MHPESLVVHVLQDIIVDVGRVDVSASTSVTSRANVFLLPFLANGRNFIYIWLCFFFEWGFIIGAKCWSTCLISEDIICQGWFSAVFFIKIVVKIGRLGLSWNFLDIIRLFIFFLVLFHLFFEGKSRVIVRLRCASFDDLKKSLVSVVTIIIELADIFVRFFSRQIVIFSFIKSLLLRWLITQLQQNILSKSWSHWVSSWVWVFLPFYIGKGMGLVGKKLLSCYLVVSKGLEHFNFRFQLHQLEFLIFFIHL